MAERGVWREGGWVWSWEWERGIRGRVAGELVEMTALIHSIAPTVGQPDTWTWNLEENGFFTVKTLRELIDGKILQRSNTWQETRWCKIIPRKVCIFIWRLNQGRIPVRFWLDHIGLDLDSMLCPHCDEEVETIDHCFLRCGRVSEGWRKVLDWWKMSNVSFGSVDEVINYKGLLQFNKKQKTVWKAVVWSTLYNIWRARNKRVFENKLTNLSTICDEVQVMSFFWIDNRVKGTISSWLEWVADPARACKF